MIILGVDIGGTFTDFVLLDNGHLRIHKLPSTPDNPARALLAGVADMGAPHALVHGTTVATNALLERRGPRTALLTTAGFADVLVLGRGNRPALYDLDVQQPAPLVPAALRLELPERLAADGSVVQPLDTAALDAAIAQLTAAGVEAVAVCLLHSYVNPSHEQQVVAALRAAAAQPDGPRWFVCASAEVLPEYREYERTSTTVVNAYVAPVLDRYLGHLEDELTAQGVSTLRIMASDGGSMSAATARRLAARTTLSGPAGGVVGARAVAQQAGFAHIITFDMGGTSTDVALCDGSLPQTQASHVGDMPVRLPAIDIHTVGAGGGSLARIDAGGALRVGPQSAGADPGPACYGRGDQPTVTDANVLLGRLRAEAFLGGALTLDTARAEAAMQPLAQALGRDLLTTAQGVIRVANAAMERAIRAISVERGHDPRACVLVAFGGAGPLHAAHLAEALGMRQVLVPRYPGVLSALGMLLADITRDEVTFVAQPLAALDAAALAQQMHDLVAPGWPAMQREAGTEATLRADFTLDLRYVGQSHEIRTPLATWHRPTPPGPPDLAATQARFEALHRQYTGHALPGHAVEVVALRLKLVGALAHQPTAEAPQPPPPQSAATPHSQAQATLDTAAALHPVAIYQRETLPPGATLAGPAVIVQLDTTTVLPSGWQARVVEQGHLLLECEA